MATAVDARQSGMPGPDDVDQNRLKRTDAALARRFVEFADLECAASGSGMSVNSPTYAALSRYIAKHPDLLALARECRAGQPIPNLLLAAVKRVVQDAPRSALAPHYERAARGDRPSAALPGAFAEFCADNRARILALLESRNVQTNEVGRCSHLMPAFGIVSKVARQPVALIDVGAGCGSTAKAVDPCPRRPRGSRRLPIASASTSSRSTLRTTSNTAGSRRWSGRTMRIARSSSPTPVGSGCRTRLASWPGMPLRGCPS